MFEQNGTFSIITLGCKANQFDSSQIARQLANLGMNYIENPEEAEIIIINTCTVTVKSDYKCRQMARKWKKIDSRKKVILTGCYVERDGKQLSELESIDLTIKRNEWRQFTEKFSVMMSKGDGLKNNAEENPSSQSFQSMTRALYKIQDGCDQRCAYCIVPSVRGSSRSVPEKIILKEISDLEKGDFKEVVLTGIHIGNWGLDLGSDYTLLSLLRKLLENTKMKIRLSSIEPNELSNDMIKFIRDHHAIRPHFHIPLQSGSDKVLKEMNRHYFVHEFEDRILKIFESFNFPGIGTDVIVGFPTENDEDFQLTCNLIERLPFSYLHVFPYSRRPGTSAAEIKGDVCDNIKTDRARHLRRIGSLKKQRFIESQIRTVREALTLEKYETGNKIKAVSDNYIQMEIKGSDIVNRIVKARIINYKNGNAESEII